MTRHRVIYGRMAAELLAWAALVGSFLFVYVSSLGQPETAIIPHLSFIANVILATICLRILIWLCLGQAVAVWVNSFFLATITLTLASYYFLVFIGLESWGRVISWKLIATYAPQIGELLRLFGWRPAAAAIMLLGTVVALAVALRALQPWLGWTRTAAGFLSPPAMLIAVLLILAILAVRCYLFVEYSPANTGEPISVTLFPEQATPLQQTYSVEEARALDKAENAARAAYTPSTHHPSRNVILIVGDALRSDHMSVYGYGRSTTPNLARMLEMPGAVKVPMVHSVCAETTCGVLALLASKFVFQIAPHSFSLIEVLRRNNYKTHLILSGDHTNFYDLRKAYGQVDDYYDGNDAQAFGYYGNDDALVVDRVAKLAPWDGGNHYFQFHLMSAHSLGSRHEEFLRYQPASDYRSWVRPSRAAKTVPSEVIAANNFYDNGVLQFDAYVARILASLSEKGYMRDALVVIVADHGDMLGEHQEFGHVKSIYENVLRIPFLLFRYGYSQRSDEDLNRFVSQVDVAPTIAFELGIALPSTWRGVPLQTPTNRSTVFVQQGSSVGLYDLSQPGRVLKYWRNVRTNSEFVYDILEDPEEQRNLVKSRSLAELEGWRVAILPAMNVTTHRSGDLVR